MPLLSPAHDLARPLECGTDAEMMHHLGDIAHGWSHAQVDHDQIDPQAASSYNIVVAS